MHEMTVHSGDEQADAHPAALLWGEEKRLVPGEESRIVPCVRLSIIGSLVVNSLTSTG